MSASKEGYRYGNLFDAHTQTTYPRVGHDMPWMSTPAKAGLRDRETRNALEVGGLGGHRPWGISSESLPGRRGPGSRAASRGRETRHSSLTSDRGQRQCALRDDDGCGVLARIH